MANPPDTDHIRECVELEIAVHPDMVLRLADALDETRKALVERNNQNGKLMDEVGEREQEIAKLRKRTWVDAEERDRLREAHERIKAWAEAYPVDIFVEPSKADWIEIARILKNRGYTLDAVSGSNMRHCLKGAGEIARTALKEEQ